MSWRGRHDDRGGWRDERSSRYDDRDRGKASSKGGSSSKIEEDTSRDWTCENCGARNFARRAECFKCGKARPRAAAEDRDPRAERERKLKAALAMGIDPSMAETVILDPRFQDSIEQYEKMQKSQEEAQQAATQQYQQAIQAQQQQQAEAAANPTQLMAAALAQGYSMEQAQLYVQQYMQQQQQQQQQAAAAAAAASPVEPAAASLIAAAMQQGYSQEQAQLYAQQYLQQQEQQAAQPQEAEEPKAEVPERVALYANTPQILNIEEGRKGQFRSTLKAVVFDTNNGRRTFQDVFVKGPWRRSRPEAVKDQGELSEAFKFDGKQGVDKRLKELDEKRWSSEELRELEGAPSGAKEEQLEEDDFDAEAESDPEPEPEVSFNHEELPIKVRGIAQPDSPVQSWQEGVQRGCIAPAVGQALFQMQLQRPTLIQRYALPLIARTGHDLLAQAQTGSGKTLAFVIPIVSRLLMNPPVTRPFFPGPMAQASPVALMLSPTRELAIQTAKNAADLVQQAGSSMSVLTMYGGETLSTQVKPIERQNQDIICATPGRLLDAIDSGKVSLMFATVVVLDEADQMLDLAVGLEGTVMQITDGRDLPRTDGRQTLLFSATMPDYQTKQFHSVLKPRPNRLKLRVGHYTEDEKGGSCRHIKQMIVKVRDMDGRWERLGRDLMEIWGSTTQRREGKGIMFTNRIALASPLESALRRVGITCGQLHGKQTQDIREDIVKRFRKGEYEMLIASNVASRGLDFPDIRLVVQFELPKTVEIYTHRIGRTGRNGQTGAALAYFCDAQDRKLAKPLSDFLRLNSQAVPEWLDGAPARRSRSRGRDGRGR